MNVKLPKKEKNTEYLLPVLIKISKGAPGQFMSSLDKF